MSKPNIDTLAMDSPVKNVNFALDFYLFWEYIPNSNLILLLIRSCSSINQPASLRMFEHEKERRNY
jgi:hypothetical protein